MKQKVPLMRYMVLTRKQYSSPTGRQPFTAGCKSSLKIVNQWKMQAWGSLQHPTTLSHLSDISMTYFDFMSRMFRPLQNDCISCKLVAKLHECLEGDYWNECEMQTKVPLHRCHFANALSYISVKININEVRTHFSIYLLAVLRSPNILPGCSQLFTSTTSKYVREPPPKS